MSSVLASRAQLPINKLFINVGDIRSSIFDATGTAVTWTGVAPSAFQTAGTAVLRDMGKTVYLPDPTVPSSANGQSTILRKVQYVPSGALGVYGTGGTGNTSGAAGVPEFYTGYIRLAAQTYGGGDGVPAGVARLN